VTVVGGIIGCCVFSRGGPTGAFSTGSGSVVVVALGCAATVSVRFSLACRRLLSVRFALSFHIPNIINKAPTIMARTIPTIAPVDNPLLSIALISSRLGGSVGIRTDERAGARVGELTTGAGTMDGTSDKTSLGLEDAKLDGSLLAIAIHGV
jgi:hypothetical protein